VAVNKTRPAFRPSPYTPLKKKKREKQEQKKKKKQKRKQKTKKERKKDAGQNRTKQKRNKPLDTHLCDFLYRVPRLSLGIPRSACNRMKIGASRRASTRVDSIEMV